MNDNQAWRRLGEVCTVRTARSPERLLDLTTFFLHRAIAKLPDPSGNADRPSPIEQGARGKHVLIVDDDIRNIFALTSVLEEHDMKIVSAENGRDAIDILRKTRRTSTSC